MRELSPLGLEPAIVFERLEVEAELPALPSGEKKSIREELLLGLRFVFTHPILLAAKLRALHLGRLEEARKAQG